MIETFKSLKNNDLIRVSMTDALIGKREKLLSVGRRSHSKKYNVEKLTLLFAVGCGGNSGVNLPLYETLYPFASSGARRRI